MSDFQFFKLFSLSHLSELKHQHFTDDGRILHVTQSEKIISFALLVFEI